MNKQLIFLPVLVVGFSAQAFYYCEEFADSFEGGVAKPRKCFAPRKLNDTGLNWGGNYPTGSSSTCTGEKVSAQDCAHGRDALARANQLKKTGVGRSGFDFTKLDSSGKPLSANAKTWACVRDNVTGLVWENKTDDDTIHDKDHTYTWYNPNNSENGGVAGTKNGGKCEGSRCDTTGFAEAVNKTKLCGFSDWRIPTPNEFASILDFSRRGEIFDPTYFVHYEDADLFATSQTDVWKPDYIWELTAEVHGEGHVSKSTAFTVQLVRGKASL